MTTSLDLDRAAMILAEAIILGDTQAAKKYGITRRTIVSYRKRLHTDKELSQIFLQKQSSVFQNWEQELEQAILAGINFVKRAAQDASTKDADTIHAVAGATNLLLDAKLKKEIIDARFPTNMGRQSDETPIIFDAIPSRIEE